MATQAKKEGAGLLTLAFAYTAAAISIVWKGLTRDGTLAAAYRQGADEIGVALRAFPESIQVQESGTVLNPTQGEIAADRQVVQPNQPNMHRIRTPSEIARDKGPYGPDKAVGQENGPPAKTPSEIARDKGPADQSPEHGHHQGHERD